MRAFSFLPTSRQGRGAGNRNLSKLVSNLILMIPTIWNLHKPLNELGLESFWVGKHIVLLGGWLSWRGHRNADPAILPHTLSDVSLPFGCFWVVSLLKPEKESGFLSSVGHFSELLNMMEVVGTSEFIVNWADVWVDWALHLQLVSEVEAVLWN